MLISLVATAILTSYRPTLYSSFKSSKAWFNKRASALFGFYILIIIMTSHLIYFIVQNLEYIGIAQDYLQIQEFIFLALILFTIRTVLRFCYEYFHYLKKSKELTLFSVVNALMFISLIILKKDTLNIDTFLKIHILSHFIILALISCRLYYLSRSRHENN